MTTLQGLDRLRTTFPVVLERAARRRFDADLQALVALPPVPGLLPVAGGGIDADGHPYIERAPTSAVSLGDRLQRDGRPLDPGEALAAVATVLGGLAALHRAGLAHGGVRPAVLLATRETGPVLADPVPPVVAERTGAPDPAFAAPEVLGGEAPAPEADVFAAAATLVHLTTGRAPWTDSAVDAETTLLRILSGARPELGVLAAHPTAATVLRQALARDPGVRPDAAELAATLTRSLSPPADDVVEGSDRFDTEPPGPMPSTAASPIDVADLAWATETSEPDPGGTPLGSRYRLHERLGSGATGVVHRATYQPARGEHIVLMEANGQDNPAEIPAEVAVKVLHEHFTEEPVVVARFLAERTTLIGIEHPNLVRIHDLVAEGSTLAIVMDLVDGPDLRRWLRTAPPLPPAAACRLLAQLAAALAALHRAGVVHRDLKPENILLAGVGSTELAVRLTDFGVARSLVDPDGPRLTQLGQVVGTPRYRAPEVTPDEPAGAPADIYAFGLVAYELLAGCRPFAAEDREALARAHATLMPGRPAGIDDRLWSLVAASLAKQPGSRPAAGELATLLAEHATTIDNAPPLHRLKAPPPPVPVEAATPAPAPLPSGLDAAKTDHDRRGRLDHVATDIGTAPLPPRPPDESGKRDRRRFWLRVAAVAAVALVVGVGLGAWTVVRQDEREEPTERLVAHPRYLVTKAERAGSGRVNLLFEPPEDVHRYVVVRDPDTPEPVTWEVQPLGGASFVEISDEENDIEHCYVVIAVVMEDATSTTASTGPEIMRPGCIR